MIDEHDVRKMLRRRANTVPTSAVDAPRAARRAHRRLLANGVVAVLAAAAIGVATIAGVDAIRSAPVPADRPTPSPGVLRATGEVLSFTGKPQSQTPGDLVAVNPETGETRVLVEGLEGVYSASWSADGRWVAYETLSEGSGYIGLWVVSASQEPRLVATGGNPDLFATLGLSHVLWSPTGAELAAVDESMLITIDPETGETTDLAPIDGDWEMNTLLSPAPAWSPDGTRIVFGARGGALYSVNVESGERSFLAHLPGENFNHGDLLWSSDGAHIAFMNNLDSGMGHLLIMNADGSNVRFLADNYDPLGVAWSPDGRRLAFEVGLRPDVRIMVTAMDGSDPAEIGSLPDGCEYNYRCNLAWSPDGSQIAFRTPRGVTAIDADGSGTAEPIDELTYASWDDGWYS